MAIRVNENNFDQEVLQSRLPVLVEFYSDSCIPCKQMAAILGELEEAYGDRLRIAKVNVNYDSSLADTYLVAMSPTVIFFHKGLELHRIRGLVKKKELEDMIGKRVTFSDI